MDAERIATIGKLMGNKNECSPAVYQTWLEVRDALVAANQRIAELEKGDA